MTFLQKTGDWFRRHKLAVGAACVALVSVLIAVWFGNTGLPMLEKKAEYVKLNDDYSVTESLDGGAVVAQRFELGADASCYGVRVKLQNDGAPVDASVTLRLYDAGTDALLGESSVLASSVLADDFTTFFIETGIKGSRAVRAEFSASADGLSLWRSDATPLKALGRALTRNGETVRGTLALQTVSRAVIPAVRTAYWVFSLLLAALAEGLYLLIFVKKAKIQTVFAVLALGVGLAFCLFTPQLAAPDEYVHYTTSYYYASGLLGKAQLDESGALLVRECDAPHAWEQLRYLNSHAYDAFAYTELAEELTVNPGSNDCTVPVSARINTGSMPLIYAPQTLGIVLARLLGLGYGFTLLFGRFFNLLLYVALAGAAIKLMPFGKNVLFAVAVWPMSLQLAGSLSYDVFVNGLSFLFLAVCLKATYADKTIGWRQTLALALIGALLSPSKAVYLVLVALCLMLPREKFAKPKRAPLARLGILGASFLSWAAYNLSMAFRTVLRQNPALTASGVSGAASASPQLTVSLTAAAQTLSEIAPNGDSRLFFSLEYILSHLEQTLALVVNTLHQNASLYLQGLVGGRLGEIILVDVEVSWVLIIGILLLTLLATVRRDDEPVTLRGGRRAWSVLVFLAVSALVVLVCVFWTPANYTTIFGIQGRYFLPVIALPLLALANNWITVKRDISRALWFGLGALDILVLFDAWSVLCAR